MVYDYSIIKNSFVPHCKRKTFWEHGRTRDLCNCITIFKEGRNVGFNIISAEINMYKFEYACRDVDEIIWDTEILSPIELRDFVKNKVKTVIKKYAHS